MSGRRCSCILHKHAALHAFGEAHLGAFDAPNTWPSSVSCEAPIDMRLGSGLCSGVCVDSVQSALRTSSGLQEWVDGAPQPQSTSVNIPGIFTSSVYGLSQCTRTFSFRTGPWRTSMGAARPPWVHTRGGGCSTLTFSSNIDSARGTRTGGSVTDRTTSETRNHYIPRVTSPRPMPPTATGAVTQCRTQLMAGHVHPHHAYIRLYSTPPPRVAQRVQR